MSTVFVLGGGITALLGVAGLIRTRSSAALVLVASGVLTVVIGAEGTTPLVDTLLGPEPPARAPSPFDWHPPSMIEVLVRPGLHAVLYLIAAAVIGSTTLALVVLALTGIAHLIRPAPDDEQPEPAPDHEDESDAARPAPDAVAGAARWEAAEESYRAVLAAFGEVAVDARAQLQAPHLADVTAPTTAAFLNALETAQLRHHDQRPDNEADLSAFEHAVDDLVHAWQAAAHTGNQPAQR